VRAFLDGTQTVEFSLHNKTERYDFVRRSLIRFAYHRLSKPDQGPHQLAKDANHQPDGQPGYIRVDTVHQGDLDEVKGLYHINAVDEVTQFEIVCAVEKISERYLIPVLEQLLDQFPFGILEFHADNGSEYINKHVVKLLKKLLIELTKSRARHSNDNALVESKNGSIIRKHLGYSHIRQHLAPLVNQFHHDYLNPYINYYRPCFFPVIKTNAKGKQVKTYPYESMMTPYEKFRSLHQPSQYLKPGINLKQLDAIAFSINDNESAKQFKEAKNNSLKPSLNRVIGLHSRYLNDLYQTLLFSIISLLEYTRFNTGSVMIIFRFLNRN